MLAAALASAEAYSLATSSAVPVKKAKKKEKGGGGEVGRKGRNDDDGEEDNGVEELSSRQPRPKHRVVLGAAAEVLVTEDGFVTGRPDDEV